MESVRSGMRSNAPPKTLSGKVATVSFRAVVALDMAVSAAVIVSPDARTLVARAARGRSVKRIVDGVYGLGFSVRIDWFCAVRGITQISFLRLLNQALLEGG